MKKISALLVLLSILSCRSDDPIENTSETNHLIGVWKLENNLVLSGIDKSTVIKEYLPDDCKKKGRYEYTIDNKYIMNDYNLIGSNCVHAASTQTYAYDRNTNTITLGQSTANVTELTDKKFVLIVQDNYDYNNDGIDDYLKYIYYR